MRMPRPAMLAAIIATPLAAPVAAQDVAYAFEWEGAGGYTMRGGLAFDESRAEDGLVTEDEVQCFYIEGYRHGAPIGRWALQMLTEETTWAMTFEPVSGQFVVFGDGAPMPQAWNMNGFGTDCGEGGFGFNIGNAAQDLCLDGELQVESQVAPSRPFPAARADDLSFPGDACKGAVLMSGLSGPLRADPARF